MKKSRRRRLTNKLKYQQGGDENSMENKVYGRMYCYLFLVLLAISECFGSSVIEKEEKPCCCYDLCEKNFTSHAEKDVTKITACQRGCRFYSLVMHVSHDLTPTLDYAHAKEGCLTSCKESYSNPGEVAACNFACSSVTSANMLCDATEYQLPQITYSLLIEESDFLIHPGESDPDDVLTDPGLRKQFEKTLEVLLDSKPKLPEIHFRNLPITNQKPSSEHGHMNMKCPKFYGFDPKLEFKNGKIIIGDLYLFFGVFGFVIICFLIGNHVETKNMTKQLMESRAMKSQDDFECDKEPLLKVDLMEERNIEKENIQNVEILEPTVNSSENIHSKFESITLVFHDEDNFKCNRNNDLKM